MEIEPFFDERTFTLTYVVYDEERKDAVIIDSVLDYDPASGRLFRDSVDELLEFLRQNELTPRYALETHAHADHLSGAQALKAEYPQLKVAIGHRITEVQQTFVAHFNLGDTVACDGSQFDALFEDGQRVDAGAIAFEVMLTPGHTPACVTYRFDDAIFTGDALFMPDMGTGRCDFPAGSAKDLYRSIHSRLYGLPDQTRVFVGHDYQPDGRELEFESTIGEQKEKNIRLKASTTEADFVAFREQRDAGLAAPRLLLPSVQVNIAAGHLPPPEENGMRYLKLPIAD